MTENITGKGQKMTMTRVFDAPRAKVWKAWTDPKLIQKWWGPKFFNNPTCEWDARPGGKIYVVMTAEDREELGSFRNMKAPMGGEFREVVPMEKLVFISTALGESGKVMLENLNTVTFEDADGSKKTKMILNVLVLNATPEMMESLRGMGDGWSGSFDKLAELAPTI